MITLVFGRRAGLFAARASKEADAPDPDRRAVEASLDKATGLVEKAGGVKPAETKVRIQAVMRKHAWVIKDEIELTEGLRQIDEIEEIGRIAAENSTFSAKSRGGYEWMTAIEVPNLLLSSRLMLVGSLERKESRGAFFRDDYPKTDDESWLKNLVYRQVGGEHVLDTVPVELKYCGP
jgi:succinate dehydrogenase / fumarate reductase flavoprotein subunit